MDQKYITTYEHLEKNHPMAAQDIYYGLELFTNSLDYGIEAFQKEIAEKNTSGDFSELSEIAEYATIVKDLKAMMDKYLNEMSMLNTIDETDIDISTEEDDEDEKTLPNYKDYVVDDEIPHTLSEVFTHKKICGFMLNGIRYNVGTWQAALIKLCELLIEKNPDIFRSFLGQPTFKGRKNNYFSSIGNGSRYYHKLVNSEIYVWTNLSTSMICEIMKKVLRGYGIPINSLYIYLRADYTPLHIMELAVEKGENANTDDKIGKYVRTTMRKLANEGYVFTEDMLRLLTNSETTKAIFGIGVPFFKIVTDDTNLSAQTKDSKGRSRYWKEVFEFNGKKYLIVSQWFEINRDRFDKWVNGLPKQ